MWILARLETLKAQMWRWVEFWKSERLYGTVEICGQPEPFQFKWAQNLVGTDFLISFSEPANFLRRMLEENEGSGKDQFLGDPDWLSEIQYNTISPLFADH